MGRKNGSPGIPQFDKSKSIWAKDYQFLGRRIQGGEYKVIMIQDYNNESSKLGSIKGIYSGKRQSWIQKHLPSMIFTFVLLGFLFVVDSYMFSVSHPQLFRIPNKPVSTEDRGTASSNDAKPPIQMYDRLIHLASDATAEGKSKQNEIKFWKEQFPQSSSWKPCADKNSPKKTGKTSNSTGFIYVSANGGLNQQRVAVCNAVAVASLLNATLVIPRFLYSNVWTDPSQFGDIYQEEYFMNVLKDDVNIVKDLPPHLVSVDFEAIGSLITDADIKKEATPDEYIEKILPLLLRNGVVHFLGYGNRLGFDPLPSELQKLRCKCNFHALKFVPKIQETGSLLIQRIRKYKMKGNMLEEQLLGNYKPNVGLKEQNTKNTPTKYLALHLRFEVDMVAYSLCEFGGGETERTELESYRKLHFPLLIDRLKNSTYVSPQELRKLGKCPLTPEESALVLAGLGFKRNTYIYLAGSAIYGGQSRMKSFTTLYPNLITKEDLLQPKELAPFRNFSSQLAALDFIACATSDVFAITDSGSQLSSLVSGIRTYYGEGQAPTLKPVKRKLASILSKNKTIEWNFFQEKVRKMIEDGQKVRVRGIGRSIYRHPRCPQCMCRSY